MTFTDIKNLYKDTKPEDFRIFVRTINKVLADNTMTSIVLSSALGKIVEDEIAIIREICRKGLQPSDREKVTMAAKLVACNIILLCRTFSKKEIRTKSMLFLEYASYLSNTDYDIIGLAIKCCSYPMTYPGFKFSTIENAAGTDMLIFKMLSEAKFDTNNPLSPIKINSAGSVQVKNGLMTVSSAPSWEDNTTAFSIHDESISICTRNNRAEKLKASEINNIESLIRFSSTFQITQDESRKAKPQQICRNLAINESYTIKIEQETFENEDGRIICTPLRTSYHGKCEIAEEELIKGIFTSELLDYLYEPDCIEGTVLVDMEEPPLFSIKKAYSQYCKKKAEEDARSRRVYQAKVLDIYRGTTPDKNRLRLISDKGYPCLMKELGTYAKGDIVTVHTIFVNNIGSEMYINAEEAQSNYQVEPKAFDNDSVLEQFAVNLNTASANLDKKESETEQIDNDVIIITQLGSILSQSHRKNSMERFKDLLTAAFILNTAGDQLWKKNTLSHAEFIHQCLRIAEGLPVQDFRPLQEMSAHDERIINGLKYLNTPEDIKGISGLILDAQDELEKQISKLLMAKSLATTNPDDFKTCSTNIRKSICMILDVADHFCGEEVKGGGKYGKGELANVEFKSSYVMSNKDGKPDLYSQGRGQVMEAVCGFMNKDGGTVYVGVNNYGDPLTSDGYGLNGDIDWFRDNFSTVKHSRFKMLGHSVPKPEDLDSYCRFLNNEMELYFKPSVRNCVTIEPTEDMDAIRLVVKPSEFEIAKLYTDNTWEDGTVYVRNGAETLPMSRHDQEQRLMKLRSVGKVEQFIITLNEAIDSKRKVILKNYSSSNGNTINDRYVVPINLVYNNENLWAYDLDEKKTKEFRLARIGAIEMVVEEPFFSHAFKKGETDVFRWINPDVNIHIKLRMELAALNYLKEEYSITKNLPEKELYQDEDGSWILDTYLHGWGAVIRFYLGLANKIEILDTEDSTELKMKIKEFVDKHLKLDQTKINSNFV